MIPARMGGTAVASEAISLATTPPTIVMVSEECAHQCAFAVESILCFPDDQANPGPKGAFPWPMAQAMGNENERTPSSLPQAICSREAFYFPAE